MTDIGNGLADFRRVIQEMKDEERRLGKTADFIDVNPEELTEDDRDIYRRLTNGTLAREIDVFEAYRERVWAEKNKSRKYFIGYIGNKLMLQQILNGTC